MAVAPRARAASDHCAEATREVVGVGEAELLGDAVHRMWGVVEQGRGAPQAVLLVVAHRRYAHLLAEQVR